MDGAVSQSVSHRVFGASAAHWLAACLQKAMRHVVKLTNKQTQAARPVRHFGERAHRHTPLLWLPRRHIMGNVTHNETGQTHLAAFSSSSSASPSISASFVRMS